jgi:transcriptional regulator with XRE-family HTH domain
MPRTPAPGPRDDAAVLDAQAAGIGARIRAHRREQGLTLVRLAALTELSHPFLSQLERGHARPSMVSLERIARALGTSQIELMAAAQEAGAPEDPNGPTVVRADEGVVGPYAGGTARLLVHSHRAFHPLEFTGRNTDPGDHYVHDEDEFVYVVEGRIVMDLDAEGSHVLGAGDSVYYSGGTRHRWSSPDGEPYRLFLVKQRSASSGRDPDRDRVFASGFPADDAEEDPRGR